MTARDLHARYCTKYSTSTAPDLPNLRLKQPETAAATGLAPGPNGSGPARRWQWGAHASALTPLAGLERVCSVVPFCAVLSSVVQCPGNQANSAPGRHPPQPAIGAVPFANDTGRRGPI